MLEIALEETQVYKDIERQTRIRIIRKLMSKNLSLEEISDIAEMPIEEIQKVIQYDA